MLGTGEGAGDGSRLGTGEGCSDGASVGNGTGTVNLMTEALLGVFEEDGWSGCVYPTP